MRAKTAVGDRVKAGGGGLVLCLFGPSYKESDKQGLDGMQGSWKHSQNYLTAVSCHHIQKHHLEQKPKESR